MKYVFPAIIAKESDGYTVSFPDVENCFTSGSTIFEALEQAEDALCLMLYDAEEDGAAIPNASSPESITAPDGAIVTLIHCDTLEYRKLYSNKAVKKTLTIPQWLNTLAERRDINFSAVLQNALKRELNID